MTPIAPIRLAPFALAAALAFLAGCESWNRDPGTGLAQGQSAYAPQPSSPASTSAGGTSSDFPGPVNWLHTDVSAWPVTASLSASVGGGTINMPYSKAKVWPSVGGVNANPWVIVNLNGQWYAATFEWFRHGQTSKPVGVLNGSMGDHIKVAPLNGWRPRSGERIGLMVSGLARAQSRNVRERSNVVMVTWP